MIGEELMALAERVAAEWQNDPNVVGVGFGGKERGGVWVQGPALRFTVRRKLDNEEAIRAAGSRPIPAQIEGVPTDVAVVVARPSGFVGSRGTHIESPLKGGVSTSVLGSFLPFPTDGGTLGGVCIQNVKNKQMALSNAHVWGSDIGSDIVQPSKPIGKFISAGVELLACGPIISFLAEGELPSGLTAVLTAGAAAAWVAAAASDAKDPHRRGQEATVPAQPGERTQGEVVRFDAEPKDLPLPGTPFRAAVAWEYTRQTDQANYSFGVVETRVNEHVLVHKQIWTDLVRYQAGRVVQIMALLESDHTARADAFHVVAHLSPAKQPERRVSRVLHPASCGEQVPFLCVGFPSHEPNTPAYFPIDQHNVRFKATHPGLFRDVWPLGSPDGHVELQFLADGLDIDVPPSSQAEAHVVSFSTDPIVLEAYDAHGSLLAKATLSGPQRVKQILRVQGNVITRLRLYGGNNEALLLLLCLRLLKPTNPQPIDRKNRLFCYRGQYHLDPTESPGPWNALLSAQTVNTVPPETPPAVAAATIGGLESSALATEAGACVIVLALDYLFDVI